MLTQTVNLTFSFQNHFTLKLNNFYLCPLRAIKFKNRCKKLI